MQDQQMRELRLAKKLKEASLSNRECEVAGIIAKGASNREASTALFVTEKTVKFHLTNIYKKLNIKSRGQLIIWCAPHLHFIEEPVPEVEPQIQTSPPGFTLPEGNS